MGRYLVGAGWCTIIDVKVGRHPDPLRKVLRSLNSNVQQYVVKKNKITHSSRERLIQQRRDQATMYNSVMSTQASSHMHYDKSF